MPRISVNGLSTLKQVKLLSCDDKKGTIYFVSFLYIHDYAEVSIFHWNLRPTMLHYKNIKDVMHFQSEEFRRK